MGFGSYDESEQERQQTNTQDDEETQNHRDEASDYEGEVSFDTDSVDELLNKFSEVKESND